MKNNKQIKIFLLLFYFTYLFNSCKKTELDFNKFNDYSPTPEFAVPLFNITLSMANIIKNNPDNLKSDENLLVHYIYKKDSLINYNIDELVEIKNDVTSNFRSSLGEISIKDFSGSKSLLLDNDLNYNFSNQTKTILNPLFGTTNFFPALNDGVSKLSLLSNFSSFSSVRFSKGWLILKVSNYFPVRLDKLQINLYNNNSSNLLGTLNYSNIAPNGFGYDSISIANQTLTNSVFYSIPIIQTASSANQIMINRNDSIGLFVYSTQLKAISGITQFITQAISSSKNTITIPPTDSTFFLTELILNKSKLKIDYYSTIDKPVQLNLTFPDAYLLINKTSLRPLPVKTIILNPGSRVDSSIDVSDIIFNLDKDPKLPFNTLRYNYTVQLINNNGANLSFDSSNFVNISLGLTSLDYRYLEGDFGNAAFPTKELYTDVDLLDDVVSGLQVEDATLTMNVSNEVSIPMDFNFDVYGISKSGIKFDAMLDTFDIDTPPIIEDAIPTLDIKTLVTSKTYSDKLGNGRINGLISLPSDQFKTIGNIILSKSETHTHINKGSTINIGILVDVPLSIKAKNVQLTDTVNFDLTEFTTAQEITLALKLINSFPFNVSTQLVFLDSLLRSIDSLNVNNLTLSATVNDKGDVIKPTNSDTLITFNKALLKKLINSKSKKIKIVSTILTANNGNQFVKIYNTYNIKAALGVIAKINLKK